MTEILKTSSSEKLTANTGIRQTVLDEICSFAENMESKRSFYSVLVRGEILNLQAILIWQ